MRKLKIAFVVDVFPSVSETFILNQLAYLIDQGHELSIYSQTKNADDLLHDLVDDYRLLERTIYLPPKVKSYFKRLRFIVINIIKNKDITFASSVLKCLNFFKLGRASLTLYVAYNYTSLKDIGNNDIIHAHFGSSGILVSYLKKVGLISGTPLMVSFHGYDISPDKTDYYKIAYQNIFAFSALLSVNSLYSYTLLKSINDTVRIEILPAGLDTQKFNKICERGSKPKLTIVFVGRLIRLKGAHLALQIADFLRREIEQEFELIIIGNGPEYPRLKSLARDLKLCDIVTMLGSLTQEEIRHQLSLSDIFLFPGIRDPDTGRCETQGLVIQEAQAMELPVVLSDIGGLKYGMRDGVSGFVVEEGNIRKFVDVLKLLACDPNLRSSMGKEGRRYAVEEYDNRILGGKLELLYNNIVSAVGVNKY